MTGQAASAEALVGSQASAAGFRSILFGGRDAKPGTDELAAPDYFVDLNLDQVVAAITATKEAYELTGFFHAPLDDVDVVNYRQAVFQDVERPAVHSVLTSFAAAMRTMGGHLRRSRKEHYHYQQQRWFLDAALGYCDAAADLTRGLEQAGPTSRGLLGMHRYLADYVHSGPFTGLREEARELRRRLEVLRYNLHIKANRVTVGRYDDEPDYASDVTKTFERFQQRTPTQQTGKRSSPGAMNHVEAQVLERVATLFPDLFASLDAFCQRHRGYLDRTISVFDREIQFYIAYLDYIAPLRGAGLTLSYPTLSASSKQENAVNTFDVALAAQLVRDGQPVVPNDVHLTDSERILVLSGPNNGGKTTLARTVGELHYLAKLGCPVPGSDVRLFLCDEIFTHFEKEEDIATLAGKLQEELTRMRGHFDRATPRSLMIMNEMFGSTTAQDALLLSQEILRRVSDLDALAVCVTFLDELACFNDKTVSMVSTVLPEDPATRTYTLVRKPADGKAYAQALAEKYGLSYEILSRRLHS